MQTWMKIAIATALPNIGGMINGLTSEKDIQTWYKRIRKPSLTPPAWIFGPVWTSLYAGMGYASYLVWRDGGGFQGPAKLPLILYGSQLALNWAWSPIFFRAHRIGLAFGEMILLGLNIALCIQQFYPLNPTAAYLMIPYLGWISFASYLTYKMWELNEKDD